MALARQGVDVRLGERCAIGSSGGTSRDAPLNDAESN